MARPASGAGLDGASCDWRAASLLVQVDGRLLDNGMFCNWLAHYRQLQLPTNPVYVVAHGESVISRLEMEYDIDRRAILSPPAMKAIVGSTNSSSSSRNSSATISSSAAMNFAGAGFYALNTAKIKIARDLIRSTRRGVVFTDIDTAFLRSPVDALAESLADGKEFAIAPETNEMPSSDLDTPLSSRHGGGFHVCACFFAACPTPMGESILDEWWRASGGENGHDNEQKAFQELLNRRPELVLGSGAGGNGSHGGGGHAHGSHTLREMGPVAILSHALFPTGRYTFKPNNETVWIHANWIKRRTRDSTNTAKIARLMSHKLWHAGCPHKGNTSNSST